MKHWVKPGGDEAGQCIDCLRFIRNQNVGLSRYYGANATSHPINSPYLSGGKRL
jgi:hypothetical protein